MPKHCTYSWTQGIPCKNAVYLFGRVFETAHHTHMLHQIIKILDTLVKCRHTIPSTYRKRYLKMCKKRQYFLLTCDLQSHTASSSGIKIFHRKCQFKLGYRKYFKQYQAWWSVTFIVSGINDALHVQFMTQSSAFNEGKMDCFRKQGQLSTFVKT